MSALTRLTAVEIRLFLRAPGSAFWGLAFPTLLLLVIGFVFPGAREPSPSLNGYRLVDLYVPITLTLAFATVSFTVLPLVLAGYRQRGVLRRLATTPVHPWRLIVANLTVQGGAVLVGAALSVTSAAVVFDIPLPGNPLGFLLVLLLATSSMLAVGLLIGSVAPTTGSAQGVGLGLYFVILFFAGIYIPRQAMSAGLRLVSDFTPAGAAAQALTDTWSGLALSGQAVLVLAAYSVVAGFVAIRMFRWE